MTQIIRITSEALQATVRRLLPSQVGFGEDLQASNVITPIIDLTPSAEGSQLPTDLSRSLSFQSVTSFNITNTTTTIADTPGFYRFYGIFSDDGNSTMSIKFVSGLTTKIIWQLGNTAQGDSDTYTPIDFIFFLDTNESVTGTTSSIGGALTGTVRQVADRYGNVSNPIGFTFE